MTPSPARLLAAAVLAAAALPSAASAAPPINTTILVDRPSGLGALPYDGAGDRRTLRGALTTRAQTADSRYVVFASTNDDLLATDDDAATHVYRLDRQTGALRQVDITADGVQPGSRTTSDEASISTDGRFVAFASNAANLAPDSIGGGIFVKDLDTGALQLASRAADGSPVLGAQAGVLSGDGRHVAFAVNGGEVYLRTLGASPTTKDIGGAADVPGIEAIDIAWDGRAVAFASSARLTVGDTDEETDVYAWRAIGGIVLVSRAGSTPAAQLTISGDGLRTAWREGATTVVMADTAAGAPVTVSDGATGKEDGGSRPAFERAGSAAPATRLDFSGYDLVPGDDNHLSDLYSVEVDHAGDPSHTHLLTGAVAGVEAFPAVAVGEGAAPIFASQTSALPGGDGVTTQIYDANAGGGGGGARISKPQGGQARAGTAGDATLVATHALSDDGSLVAFSSAAPALGAISPGPDTYGVPLPAAQGLLRDVPGATTTLVGANVDGTPADGVIDQVTLDATGRHAAFRAQGALMPALVPPVAHAHVRDLATGTNVIVDRRIGGALAQRSVDAVVLAADGRHVVFTSSARDLPGSPNDDRVHAYLADVSTGAIALVDRGPDGAASNAPVTAIDVNGDGTRVAFASKATNLGAGDPGGNSEVYLRDLAAGTTTWVSVPEDRDPKHADGQRPSLDRAGDTVAYLQYAPQFGHGTDPDVRYGVFVTEVANGATELAGAGADDPPSLSADGTRVAFVAARQDGRDLRQAFLRDRTTSTTTAVLPAAAARGALGVSLSGDGSCVALRSDSTDLGGGYGPDFAHVYERCVARPVKPGPPPGPGTPPPAGPPSAPRDRTAPVIAKAKLSRARFAVAKTRTATKATATAKRRKAAPKGTTIGFRLSERATITVKIIRRKGAKTIVTLTRANVRAGTVKIAYSGQTKTTRLKPGTYRAEIRATDAAGNRSQVTRLSFTAVSR